MLEIFFKKNPDLIIKEKNISIDQIYLWEHGKKIKILHPLVKYFSFSPNAKKLFELEIITTVHDMIEDVKKHEPGPENKYLHMLLSMPIYCIDMRVRDAYKFLNIDINYKEL